MSPVTDHVFQSGDHTAPWCHFPVGEQLVQTSERPMGATYARVPKFCNKDAEDHSMQPLNMHYRYVAKRDTEQSYSTDDLWLLLDTPQEVDVGGSRWFTEAEANVCAWALNVVARGGTLAGRIPDGTQVMSNGDNATVFECLVYDGPTKGINEYGIQKTT